MPQPVVPAPTHAAAPWQHPQANAHIQLGQPAQTVAYCLKRSARRRTLGFGVNALGLSVHAPSHLPLAQIEATLQEKAAWVLRHLHRQAQTAASRPAPLWADGAEHLLHGQPLRLQLCPELPRGSHRLSAHALQLALPADASAEAIERAAMRLLLAQAQSLFSQRLNHFAPRMGVQWRQLRLSRARSRWGSAKADGSIRLHWRLVQMPPELLDYVVVHELAHLHEMNHSPRFWAIVQQHCPQWRALRQALKNWPS